MFTDRTALTTAAYADRGPLAARLSIYEYQRDRVDLPGLAVQALAGVKGWVLDAGCGLGTYVDALRDRRPDLRVVPVDLSVGMGPELVGDVQALPLVDASVDGALAMHMLYHVPDIPAAIRELRRVVRPGGVLLASTNGVGDKREVAELFTDAVSDLTGVRPDPPPDDDRFTLADVDLLRDAFGDVHVHVFDRVTVVPEVDPVVGFMDSLRALDEAELPRGVTWDALLDRVRERVTATIGRSGVWTMRNQIVLFTCR